MSDANALKEPNPWHPMTDAIAVKHLLKLGEELAECGAATCRCLMQGIDEKEPVTGKVNRDWLMDEIADVLANVRLVREHFKLSTTVIQERIERKVEHLRKWHAQA